MPDDETKAGAKKGRELSALALRFFARTISDAALREAVLGSLVRQDAGRPAVIWVSGTRPSVVPWPTLNPVPWQPPFTDRLAPGTAVGRDPLHETGAVYSLDTSSVFEASVMLACGAAKPVVVDLCAAPGGKAIFASAGLGPSLLMANEVVSKRHAALISNLTRCRVARAAVTCEDPERLAALFPQSADLVIVDAPCSGQSLIARGIEADGCFHPALIAKNVRRQRRILAQARELVAPGGFLAYMTCTFSREENEANVEWLCGKFPDLSVADVPSLDAHRSTMSDHPCYRMWPHEGFGAGGFTSLFRRIDRGERGSASIERVRVRWRSPER